MKHRLLLFLSMLFITTYINAQNEITGFLGIKLEDKPYVAIDKLKKRYSNVEWKFPCIHLDNVTFIDTRFDNLTITFKNEKLVEAKFTLSDFVSVADNPFKDRATLLNEAKQSRIRLQIGSHKHLIVWVMHFVLNMVIQQFLLKVMQYGEIQILIL